MARPARRIAVVAIFALAAAMISIAPGSGRNARAGDDLPPVTARDAERMAPFGGSAGSAPPRPTTRYTTEYTSDGEWTTEKELAPQDDPAPARVAAPAVKPVPAKAAPRVAEAASKKPVAPGKGAPTDIARGAETEPARIAVPVIEALPKKNVAPVEIVRPAEAGPNKLAAPSVAPAPPKITAPVAEAPAKVSAPVVEAAPAKVAAPVAEAAPKKTAAPVDIARPVETEPEKIARPAVIAAPAKIPDPVVATLSAKIAASVVEAAPAKVAAPTGETTPAKAEVADLEDDEPDEIAAPAPKTAPPKITIPVAMASRPLLTAPAPVSAPLAKASAMPIPTIIRPAQTRAPSEAVTDPAEEPYRAEASYPGVEAAEPAMPERPTFTTPSVPELDYPGNDEVAVSAPETQEIPQAMPEETPLAMAPPGTIPQPGDLNSYLKDDDELYSGVGSARDFVAEADESSPIGMELREAHRRLKTGEEADGLLIVSVVKDSAAARAGLRPSKRAAHNLLTVGAIGAAIVFPPAILILPVIDYAQVGESYDMIIGVDGSRVSNFVDFQDRMRNLQPGELVYLSVVRDGKRVQIAIPVPVLPASASK